METGVSNKVTVSMPGSDTKKTDTENVPVEASTSGYVIHATTGANGSMTAGDVTIDEDHPADVPIADGGRVTFAITPDEGYAVKSITVDWETHGYPVYHDQRRYFADSWWKRHQHMEQLYRDGYEIRPEHPCGVWRGIPDGDGISDDLEQHILVFAMYDNDFAAAKEENKRVAEFLVPTGTNLYEYIATPPNTPWTLPVRLGL